MATQPAYGDFPPPSRWLQLWRRVREFAVPPSMIETAGARRAAGDWGGACAAARVDVDLNLRTVASRHGSDVAAQIRDDLRHLAPDLLRWHMPRIVPDGLLRPGLTVGLACYARPDAGPPLHLVARTSPGWADAGQRFSLAIWDPTRPLADVGLHPHPRPGRRFRLDLHRHLWDVRRTDELRARSGAELADPEGPERWAAEAAILLRAEAGSSWNGAPFGPQDGPRDARGRVGVRIGSRRLLVLDTATGSGTPPVLSASARSREAGLPLLPDASIWTPPDLALLRAGLVDADALHPFVASALAPGHKSAGPRAGAEKAPGQQIVECRGSRHRIAVVDGVLSPLDHDPDELRREELLIALGGPPLPCLRTIDLVHRGPDCLDDVRGRLDHGDLAGAIDVVEALLGPDAVLRDGALRDELAEAALRRIDHGLYRAGLIASRTKNAPRPPRRDVPARRFLRSRPRYGIAR
ncbi:hypothetical protein DN069_26275 [Streptacidiphilus pinicola]|uniref:Uncharacterized protein n=1 Tax=Streptacidiphilus pinicola TaxID=2219663 RepID=A0A2X0IGU7_9ACTN|nr:hypothetical protein [Streptacidiphilus pinicola]RAG82631.1 hypothetical protein DN069_26275 [Streptacidiphilus pinicola]